jgi:hypothetical protein
MKAPTIRASNRDSNLSVWLESSPPNGPWFRARPLLREPEQITFLTEQIPDPSRAWISNKFHLAARKDRIPQRECGSIGETCPERTDSSPPTTGANITGEGNTSGVISRRQTLKDEAYAKLKIPELVPEKIRDSITIRHGGI